IFKISTKNKIITVFFGVIFQVAFLSICAFFYRINLEVFILNTLLVFLLFFKFKLAYLNFLKSLFTTFTRLQFITFTLIFFLISLKSAQLPTIFDNESYYIQTIKWLNEYGFVKGVANVHPFLGQFSFWHVLQSGFNFSFLTSLSNDINGFLLVIVVYYYFEKQEHNPLDWSFLWILFLVVYFQFVDAPSPDLPILLFSSIVFYEFIKNSIEVKSILLFIVCIVFIKVTMAPLLLVALYYIVLNKKLIPYFSIISLFFGIIWILKNVIISGLPFYPLTIFPTHFDWQMKIEVLKKLTQATIDAGYTENLLQTSHLSLLDKLKFWIQLDGLNSIFNKGIIFLFLAMPFLPIFKTNKNFKFLYFVLLIHFMFLLFTSPQYRFFLPIFILFLTLLIFHINTQIKILTPLLTYIIAFTLLVISLFVDVKTSNTTHVNAKQIIVPEPITRYSKHKFEKKTIKNFYFYDPGLSNFYETSNGGLPCVNENLLYYYNYFPQTRTTNIKDGFISIDKQTN
ncbi:MAG TPA: hypothetical protein DDZ41_09770, partial [Flavobacterium sp.]|nr:hypothetical protein [Flavobacterium sp.]